MSEIFCGTVQISNENLNKLSKNESDIKLFKIKLSNYYHLVSSLIKYLSTAELERAKKYHFEKDTNRFIICRTLLKFILAQHTNIDISEIHIEKDENKKPYISSINPIHFNVSHSEDFGIIALSNKAVGVDVEYLNKNFDYSEMLPNVFSSLEIDAIKKSNTKDYTFYKFWTRKEAIVKATGKGIDDSLCDIIVLDGAGRVPEDILGPLKTITVFSFELNEGYIASVAITGSTALKDRILFHPIPHAIHLLLNKK